MPEKSKIYDKEMITQLRDMEKSIVESTLTDEEKQFAREAEKSSVRFLEGFTAGKIKLTDDAYDVMANYLFCLSLSDNPEIAQNLSSASRIYQTYANARQKKKHLQEVIQSVGEFDIEAVKKGNFSILENKKKREALTSLNLIDIAEAMRSDKTRNTTVRQNQLKDFAQKRIDDVLRGERKPDEGFDKLVQTLGSYKQQDAFYKRRDELGASKAPNVKSSDDISPKKVEVADEKPSPKREDKKEQPKIIKIDEGVKYPKIEEFGILQNKKRAQALTAAELLMLSDRLLQVKKAPKKYQFRTDKIENALRSYSQSLIDRMGKGDVAYEKEAEKLSVRYCTPQQRNAFSYRLKNESHSKKKEDDKIIILPIVEEERPILKEDKEESKKVIKKESWFKRAWDTVKKPMAAAAALFVLAFSSAAIHKSFSGERKVSGKDDAQKPLTEQTAKVNAESKVVSEAKVITPEDIQQELQNAKQQIKGTTQAKEASNQGQELSKEDQEYAKRTASFLKISTRDNKVAKESDLNKFVESIKDKLPEGVSVERMKYLASFYRLYPDHPFGAKMNKMFNGEEVSVSTEEIAELSQKHGKLGGKYVHSSRAPKVTPDFSR